MHSNKRIYLSVPHLGNNEAHYVKKAFDDNWISTVGENINELEKSIGHAYNTSAVAVSSGTAAIQLGLKSLGVTQGDEVVVPSLTFVAGANPVLYQGGTPVFIDSETQSWNMDPNLLIDFLKERAKTNKLPKVVTVAHLFGQSADLKLIKEICDQYEIPLLEDAAESIGSRYKDKQTGTFGDVGVFSFNGNKMITASSGGVFLSEDVNLCRLVRKWSTQSREEDPTGINNYIHHELGFNYRMSNVLAGIARGQFEVLDKRVEQRRKVFLRYKEAFSSLEGIYPQPEVPWGNHTRWLSCFLIEKKSFGTSQSDIIRNLESNNIESRAVWKPLHTQKLFEGYEYLGGRIAEDLNENGICLPSSSSLLEAEQDRVIACIKKLHKSSK